MNKIKLYEICDILNGYAFKSVNYVDSGIRVIRITNVQNGYIEDKEPQFYPLSYEKEIQKYILKENDILISLTGNVGRVALLDKKYLPAALNQRVACMRLKNDIIYKSFLFHFLNSDFFENKCISNSKGIAQLNLSTEWLKNYEIPLYEFKQQIEIANKFDVLSKLIDNRKSQLIKLEELVKSRFIEMFGDPVINPFSWDIKKLLDMGYCKNGMNFHTGDYGVKINCLGVGDFKDLFIIDNTEQLPYISLNAIPADECMLKDEDIVFVRSNGNKELVGRCLVVYPKNTPTTYSGFCIRYRRTSDDVNTIYLLYVLKCESIRKQMLGRGANIQNLNQQILSNLIIPIPPIELQEQFSSFAKQIDKSKLAIEKSIEKLEILKKSLMQEYFG